MNELELALVGDSAAAPPSRILEGISEELARRETPGAPHTIYSELWHITFWQQMSLDWIHGIETPCPEHASRGFPSREDIQSETWSALCERFLDGNQQAGAAAADIRHLEKSVRCPSLPGQPTRTMTVREQLESLAAHNAYHFGRIVLLRQINKSWPPVSGGFTW